MITRCIYLRPEHPRLAQVQKLRLAFDPLAEKIPPHLTVVFPFTVEWTTEKLASLIKSAKLGSLIQFSLGSPALDGDYLYFPIENGRGRITAIHDTLYASLPRELLSTEHPFVPHLTFGRLKPGQDAPPILAEARKVLPFENGTLASIILERIGPNDESRVDYEEPLATPPPLSTVIPPR